jgi:8-oxo-dGTP pyrophosphatase MutT (NUDIX family)
MLFMVPSATEYNQTIPELTMPQIAKGRIERFENPLPAAIRECAEELGLIEENIEQIIEGGVVLGRTHMYGFKILDKTAFTGFSSETASTLWLTHDQFMDTGRDLHKPVVDAIHTLIVEKYFTELV